MKKYYINTYGCQMNIHESEKLAGMLKKLGYEPASNQIEADIIVFNTCCIRESAEQKIYGNIGALKRLKREKKDLIIAVCGCMSQQKGSADIIKNKYPFVDIVFGTHNLHKFEEYLENHQKNHKKIYEVFESEFDIAENIPAERTSSDNAWLNIMYGCNNFCTYCIVPYVRGRERSRKMSDIISEAAALVNKGYKIITLLGQNVNSYSYGFANLLSELCKIKGDFQIKFMTSHPKDLTDEVIKVIACEPKISKEIHLPMQSGSTKILTAMNRKYTAQDYKSLIDKIKKAIPDVRLTSDIIVGFPDETEQDFIDTCEMLKYCKFSGIFAFMYSKRKGTPAEKMENQIPIKIKRERVNIVLALQKSIQKNRT